MPGVGVRFGRPIGARQIAEAVNAATILEIAKAGIKRTQRRISHPSVNALQAETRGARRADIFGWRGGPRTIRPVSKKALYWPGARHPVAFVKGAGFGPLIIAETRRVTTADIDMGAISAAATTEGYYQ